MKKLSKRHFRQLHEESGIATEVIEARGYRTIRSIQDLREYGYRPRVHMTTPGLLIPLHLPGGPLVTRRLPHGPVTFRPDSPWVDPNHPKGRPTKYAAPVRTRPYIDVHPLMRAALSDTDKAAFIVEGHKKADAATSHGLLTLGLSGVDNFMYKPRDERGNVIGSSRPCEEWNDIPMDRDFVIVFDSDLASNPRVFEARRRLTRFLYLRGGRRVFWVNLPAAADVAKTGLDDWFVAGGTIADLRALLAEAPNTINAPGGGRSRRAAS